MSEASHYRDWADGREHEDVEAERRNKRPPSRWDKRMMAIEAAERAANAKRVGPLARARIHEATNGVSDALDVIGDVLAAHPGVRRLSSAQCTLQVCAFLLQRALDQIGEAPE